MKENRFPRLDKPRREALILLLAPLVLAACANTIPVNDEGPGNVRETTVPTTTLESEILPNPPAPGRVPTTTLESEILPNPPAPGRVPTTTLESEILPNPPAPGRVPTTTLE